MIRLSIPILALAAAAMTAILLGYLAHDTLGIPRATIRFDALTSAAFVGFIFLGSVWRGRDR